MIFLVCLVVVLDIFGTCIWYVWYFWYLVCLVCLEGLVFVFGLFGIFGLVISSGRSAVYEWPPMTLWLGQETRFRKTLLLFLKNTVVDIIINIFKRN